MPLIFELSVPVSCIAYPRFKNAQEMFLLRRGLSGRENDQVRRMHV